VPRIVSIVEGDGELAAVPIIIRRVADDLGIFDVHGYSSVLTRRNQFPRFPAERERALAAARSQLGGYGAILIVLDSDGEPPCRDPRHQGDCIRRGESFSRVARAVVERGSRHRY
jgi:hypothetical protein